MATVNRTLMRMVFHQGLLLNHLMKRISMMEVVTTNPTKGTFQSLSTTLQRWAIFYSF